MWFNLSTEWRSVRAALTRADPNLPATEFRTMQQLVDHSLFGRRLVVRLLVGFAGFGLVLASLGIYAMVSYSVGQRRPLDGRESVGEHKGQCEVRRRDVNQTQSVRCVPTGTRTNGPGLVNSRPSSRKA